MSGSIKQINQLVTFLIVNLIFKRQNLQTLTAASWRNSMWRGPKMAKFLTSYIDFLFIFRNLSRIRKENHLSTKSELNLSKVNATATIPSCKKISSFARALVHDVACRCDMNCVCSKAAHKQLARTSLR